MNRTFVFSLSLFWLVAARLSDLAATFHYDPSLSLEGNPVVLLLGGGRVSLLAAVLIPSGAIALGLLVFWMAEALVLNRQRPASLRVFIQIWLMRVVLDRQPFTAYLRGQSHWNEGLQAIRLFGVGLAWAMIFGSLAATYGWSAIWEGHSPAYKTAFHHLSVGRFPFMPAIIALLGFLFGTGLFFRCEYIEVTTRIPHRND